MDISGERILVAVPGREDTQNFLEFVAHALEVSGVGRGKWKSVLVAGGLGLNAQLLARSGDGETVVIKQLLDADDVFDVAAAVHALTGVALARLQLRELGLPKAEDVSGQMA